MDPVAGYNTYPDVQDKSAGETFNWYWFTLTGGVIGGIIILIGWFMLVASISWEYVLITEVLGFLISGIFGYMYFKEVGRLQAKGINEDFVLGRRDSS